VVVGELKSQIDAIWNSFWSGGISNPLEVMEQITYLLFIKRLDDLQTLEENNAAHPGQPLARAIFPDGVDDKDRPFADFRWSRRRWRATPRSRRLSANSISNAPARAATAAQRSERRSCGRRGGATHQYQATCMSMTLTRRRSRVRVPERPRV
jgi:hypothetical protein